ncbi:MAG: outer membrane protein assembly factor BamE [Planctomycetota bacterium]
MRKLQRSTARVASTALLAGLLSFTTSGCFLSRSRDNPVLDRQDVEAIVPGVSTQEHVTQLLGAPNEVVQLGRRSAWRFEHTVQKQTALFLVILSLRGVDTQSDRIWVFFDEEGTVTTVGSMFLAKTAEYDLPVF